MEDRDMKCYKKDYPRPQFVRDNWVNLNGTWDFGFDDANQGEKEKWYEKFPGELKIEVPFTYETKLSGIQDERRHDNIWYHKTITVDASKLTDNRLLIHFEGSDFHTKLWVNGAYAGDHKGGYARFSFDITELVKDGENELTVKVEDSFDTQQPRGKQRWIDENFGCWYVQTTGIWKTVWTEYVPDIRLDYVKMTPNLHDMALEIEYQIDAPESAMAGGNLMVVATVTFGDMLISKTMTVMTSDHTKTKIDVFHKTNGQANCGMEWGVRTWSPESPDLYDITFEVVSDGKILDTVGSYFAMREIDLLLQFFLLLWFVLLQLLQSVVKNRQALPQLLLLFCKIFQNFPKFFQSFCFFSNLRSLQIIFQLTDLNFRFFYLGAVIPLFHKSIIQKLFILGQTVFFRLSAAPFRCDLKKILTRFLPETEIFFKGIVCFLVGFLCSSIGKGLTFLKHKLVLLIFSLRQFFFSALRPVVFALNQLKLKSPFFFLFQCRLEPGKSRKALIFLLQFYKLSLYFKKLPLYFFQFFF